MFGNTEFVSDPLKPIGPLDTGAMAGGEPGLPAAFEWRGETFPIAERLEQWKFTSPEGGRARGEVYLRRHYYRVRMSNGDIWTVYFVRQTPKSGNPHQRWFLYERVQSPKC